LHHHDDDKNDVPSASPLRRMEDDMTQFLRQQGKDDLSNSTSITDSALQGNDEVEGTFVRLSWCTSKAEEEETRDDSTKDSPSRSKRRRNKRRRNTTKKRGSDPSKTPTKRRRLVPKGREEDLDDDSNDPIYQPDDHSSSSSEEDEEDNVRRNPSTATAGGTKQQHHEPQQQQQQLHLLVDIFVQDQSSAQIVCCFPHFTAAKPNRSSSHDNDNNTNQNTAKAISGFEFLLLRGSKASFELILAWLETFTGCAIAKSSFAPTVANVAQALALWTARQTRDDDKKDSDSSKPLTFTYAVPPDMISSGLETLALTVPPGALLRLCQDIMALRPASTNYNANTAPSILKCLECFLQETFRIKITKFPLISGTCAAAVLGCDGRCKPLSAPRLDQVLGELRFMIHQQDRTRRPSKGT